jgi:hypothetical protein
MSEWMQLTVGVAWGCNTLLWARKFSCSTWADRRVVDTFRRRS